MRTPKATYVHGMFSRIAPYYDLLNRVMTLSFDLRWRRAMALSVPPSGLVLDLAAGTGDSTLAFLKRQPRARVVAIDFCRPMLERAVAKLADFSERVLYVQGDAHELPFAAGTFDAVVTAFAMRNLSDVPLALAEIHRVLKPGGVLACLEIATPPWQPARALFDFYFGRIIPRVGGLLSGNRSAYDYLPRSLRRFTPPEEFKGLMEAAGFGDVRYRFLFPGTAVLHRGVKDSIAVGGNP